MKYWLHTEEIGKFLAAYWLTLHFGYSGWLFFAWLLAPDLSMIGYLINTRLGAILYNLAHHQGIAVTIAVMGVLYGEPHLVFAGALLFGHSAMDRIFGYGLKYPDDFKHTHLGWIGKK